MRGNLNLLMQILECFIEVPFLRTSTLYPPTSTLQGEQRYNGTPLMQTPKCFTDRYPSLIHPLFYFLHSSSSPTLRPSFLHPLPPSSVLPLSVSLSPGCPSLPFSFILCSPYPSSITLPQSLFPLSSLPLTPFSLLTIDSFRRSAYSRATLSWSI